MRKVVMGGMSFICLCLMTACNLTGVQSPAPTSTPTIAPEVTTLTPLIMETPSAAGTVILTPVAPATSAPITEPASEVPTSVTSAVAVIIAPANDSVVSGTPLSLNGVVNNLPDDSFTLELHDSAGNIINTQEITLRNPNRVAQVSWSASLFTRYVGGATVYLRARDRQGRAFTAASVRITIAAEPGASDVSTTTEPVVTIANPRAESMVLGDPIVVNGTAGGIFENKFILELRASSGASITSQIITLSSTDPALVVPWSSTLATGDYSGAAELRAFYERTSDGQPVILASIRITLGS